MKRLRTISLIIVAQGYIDLGDTTYAHRYYSADDTMIQVMTVAGVEDEHVEELTLYLIEQNKEIQNLKKDLQEIKSRE